MEANIIDLIKGQLSDTILSKVAGFLGEDQAAASKAMGLILPSVLGGMANKASNADGATELFGLMNNQDHSTDIFGALGTLLGGGSATQGLMDTGGSVVSALFGNKTSNIASVIASAVGMKTGSASSLMSIAAPILMNVLARKMGGGATASGLVSLLGSQLPFLRNSGLPTSLTNALGLSSVEMTPPAVSAPRMAAETGGLGNFLPWLLLLAAALAGFYFFKTCNVKTPEAPVAAEQTTGPIAPAVVETVKKLDLPSGDIEVKIGSFLDKLYDEITDPKADLSKALTFDNVNFAPASAQLTEESKTQLNDLAKIMTAFPNVHIKVDGHTDNVGPAGGNLRLSQARAASVKTYLGTHGVDGARIATAGFGSTVPVGDNATAEGKAQNRRIEAFVTKK